MAQTARTLKPAAPVICRGVNAIAAWVSIERDQADYARRAHSGDAEDAGRARSGEWPKLVQDQVRSGQGPPGDDPGRATGGRGVAVEVARQHAEPAVHAGGRVAARVRRGGGGDEQAQQVVPDLLLGTQPRPGELGRVPSIGAGRRGALVIHRGGQRQPPRGGQGRGQRLPARPPHLVQHRPPPGLVGHPAGQEAAGRGHPDRAQLDAGRVADPFAGLLQRLILADPAGQDHRGLLCAPR